MKIIVTPFLYLTFFSFSSICLSVSVSFNLLLSLSFFLLSFSIPIALYSISRISYFNYVSLSLSSQFLPLRSVSELTHWVFKVCDNFPRGVRREGKKNFLQFTVSLDSTRKGKKLTLVFNGFFRMGRPRIRVNCILLI